MKTGFASPAAVLVGLLACPCFSQEPGKTQEAMATIRVDVALVNLTVTVVDREGRPVPGLKKDDFEVYEDGVPQQIAVFRDDEDIPVSVGIVFDTSGSMVDKIDEVRDAVVHFVNTVNPEDDIFVMQFSTQISLVQDFTADRERLRRAVSRLRAQGSTSLYDAIRERLAACPKGTSPEESAAGDHRRQRHQQRDRPATGS